ncbi:unnamed protein product [Spirodela intermedia]|uniref:Uncharacterized protein n=1 Tax=Spirodela intermedia TaxID=51605 RepID=A0ABN7E8C4_SPIIN|nr:unnamed protein product [Spirodela intermedia]
MLLPKTSALVYIGEADGDHPSEFRRLKRRGGFSWVISVSSDISSGRRLKVAEHERRYTRKAKWTKLQINGWAFFLHPDPFSVRNIPTPPAGDSGARRTGAPPGDHREPDSRVRWGTFVLGFFFGRRNRYLGIWYNKIPNRTAVWVANRDQPLIDSAAFFTVTADRNLALVDSNGSFVWSSNLASVPSGTVAMLLESGNLVLRQRNGQDVWQSFDHPTDTILPEMKLRYNTKTGLGQRAVAWRDVDDPSSGNFSAGPISNQIFIWRGSETNWRFPVLRGSTRLVAWHESSPSRVQCVVWLQNRWGTAPARCTLEPSGELKMMVWEEAWSEWRPLWIRPTCFCDVYNLCGPSGVCNCNAEPPTCICLQGFVPKNQTEWEKRTFSNGCVRRVPLQCSKSDKFLAKKTEFECRADCISNCQCIAYAYANTSVESHGYMCLVWYGDLIDLEIDDNIYWENLNIRLVASGTDKQVCLEARKRTARWTTALEDIDFSDAFGRDKSFSEAPMVEFRSVRCATCDFSVANKLGEGGFGSVYKSLDKLVFGGFVFTGLL